MLMLIVAYLRGVLTFLRACILPVLLPACAAVAAVAAVLAGVGAMAPGLDTGVLARLSTGSMSALEQAWVDKIDMRKPPPPRAEPVARLERTGFVRTAATARDLAIAPMPALGVEGTLPPLAGATEWINSPPLTAEGLRGKVVLIDFWTYSCINCLRTLPYLRAWAEKYKDAGLVVVGVHAPEFAFEKRSANVHKAVKDLGVAFPVAVDSNFAIWRAFGNQYWPAFYFVDAQGRIRHHQFGENQYAKSEQVIQQLLAEAGQHNVPADMVLPQGQGTQAAPDAEPPLSQETYLGTEHAQGFASPGGIASGRAHVYEPAASLRTNQWALAGDWTVEPERTVLNHASGRIAYRFKARDLHLVLGPAADGEPVRFRVRIDGKPPLADHGSDVDAQGNGTIDAQKLYQLVRQSANGKDRLFEIEFLDAGAQAYVFTFG